MSELDFESRLGGQLRAYADGGVRPIDRYAIAEATAAAGSTGRPAFRLGWPRSLTVRTSRRMALILVAMATVLALAGSALLFSAGQSPAPTPSLAPASPTPTSAGPTPAVSDSSGYEAILLRGVDPVAVRGYTIAAEIDIVAMRANGQERLVSHISSSILPAGRSFRMGGEVTEDGWLSMPTFVGEPDKDFAYALIDLAHPAREPLLVPSVLTGAWGPGGLFASVVSRGWRIQIVDARTGSKVTEIRTNLPGGGPSIVWAADGSGLLVGNAFDRSGQRGYGIVPIGGGPPTVGVPPVLTIPRIIGADGAMLCVSFFSFCGTSEGTVRTKAQTVESGTTTTWYAGELAPASLVEASFSADGRSIWLLLDRKDGLRHVAVIARADAPGAVHVVSTVDLGLDAFPESFSLAPDDSIVELYTTKFGGGPKAGPHVLITTADGAARVHLTGSSGFVLRMLTDTWPGGGTFSPAPDATTPSASDGTASPSGH